MWVVASTAYSFSHRCSPPSSDGLSWHSLSQEKSDAGSWALVRLLSPLCSSHSREVSGWDSCQRWCSSCSCSSKQQNHASTRFCDLRVGPCSRPRWVSHSYSPSHCFPFPTQASP